LNRHVETWHSPVLEREMAVASWGHWGKPVLLFATAASDCLDYERFKLIEVLRPLIEAGRIKVFSCESVSGDGWLNPDAPAAWKTSLQARFDRYLVDELLPYIAGCCGGARPFAAAGSSLGAYNAVNAALKHPEWFDLAIGMSGTYDFDRWVGGHRDMDYYFNQPLMFVPQLQDGPALSLLRSRRFVVATGQGRAEAPDESRRLARVLATQGIPVDLEIWGDDVHHDWPTWRTMLPLFLDRLLPA
jgi:esterase/lipase superfamily enzyme